MIHHMRVHRNLVTVIQVLLVAVILVGVGFLAWFLLNTEVDTADQQAKAHLLRLQASAKAYHGRLGFYDGLCRDVGLPAGFACAADANSYAIETRMTSGRYLCLDSRGHLGEREDSKGSATACGG